MSIASGTRNYGRAGTGKCVPHVRHKSKYGMAEHRAMMQHLNHGDRMELSRPAPVGLLAYAAGEIAGERCT